MTTLDPFTRAYQRLYPPPPDTFARLGYTPNPGPQTELHTIPPFSDGGPFDLLYGGAAFGGKSYGLLMDTLHDCNRYPGLEAWWVREDYPQLRSSVIRDLERIAYAKALGCTWHGGDKVLRFPNGSLISFLHARNLADASQMLSASCQKLVLDERTTLAPDVVEKLATRVRSGRPGVPVIGVRSASNPGGKGHTAVKTAFIDPAPLGRVRIEALDPHGNPIELAGGRRLDRYFLPARIDDNPAGLAADPDYAARFSMMNPDLAAAYRDGDWSRFEGMRFGQFDPRIHVVAPFELPLGGVARGLGIDYGMSAPFAAVWGAILNEQLIIYRELHQPGLTPTEQAKLILASEAAGERDNGRPVPAWLDDQAFARAPEKPLAKPIRPGAPPPGSIAHGYETAGVGVRRAGPQVKDRVAGFSLIDELLAPLPDGRPGVVFMASCPNVIRSLSGAPRATSNPEDVDADYRDDHALDAFRYLCMGLAGQLVGRRVQRTAVRHRGGRVRGITGGLARAGL